jgi:hypothetical protein
MIARQSNVTAVAFALVSLTLLAVNTANAQVQPSALQLGVTNAEGGWTVRRFLSDVRYKKTTWTGAESVLKEPCYRGQPLTKVLRNKNSSGTNELTLDEMFTLKQVITGDEPEVVTYQVPVGYDAIMSMRSETNAFPYAQLRLLMDSNPEESWRNEPELTNCERAPNGDCRLAWNTAFERPGQHAVQALLLAELGINKELQVRGPVKPFFSSNLCQFIPASTLWDDTGAYIDACRLPESNAVYRVEVKTRSGTHVKTFNGRTTNGVIHVDWDLLDDDGRKYTNHSFVSYFHVTLPGSGRSQTLKQPQNKLGTSGD